MNRTRGWINAFKPSRTSLCLSFWRCASLRLNFWRSTFRASDPSSGDWGAQTWDRLRGSVLKQPARRQRHKTRHPRASVTISISSRAASLGAGYLASTRESCWGGGRAGERASERAGEREDERRRALRLDRLRVRSRPDRERS